MTMSTWRLDRGCCVAVTARWRRMCYLPYSESGPGLGPVAGPVASGPQVPAARGAGPRDGGGRVRNCTQVPSIATV